MSYHEYGNTHRHYNGHRLQKGWSLAEILEMQRITEDKANDLADSLVARMGKEKYRDWLFSVVPEQVTDIQFIELALQAHKDLDCTELFQEISELRQF